MRWLALVCMVLVACVQVPVPVNETVYKSDVVNSTKVEFNESVLNVSEEVVANESNASNEITGGFIEDLTIGQQGKMVPELTAQVKGSDCYAVTWENFTEYSAQYQLSVEKDVNFDYLGGHMFKGFILSKLMHSREMLASANSQVVIEDGLVTCLDDRQSYPVDWKKVVSKLDR